MKLDNKGFAITAILYGTLILFMLLFLSLLGILKQYKSNLEKLIEEGNGARVIVTNKCKDISSTEKTEIEKGGLYRIDNGECKYYSSGTGIPITN